MKNSTLDIQSRTDEELEAIFNPLYQFKNMVFWIRDREMTKQIFCSKQYEEIWAEKISIIKEMPLLWLDYLDKENLVDHMQSLQSRHDKNYDHKIDNIALYIIRRRDQEKRYIYCQAIKCKSGLGKYFIIGISVSLPENEWLNAMKTKNLTNDKELKNAENIFLKLLKKHFNFNEVTSKKNGLPDYQSIQELISRHEKVELTGREIECLYYFCHGKTAKAAAKLIDLSYRTVEEYLEKIKMKSNCTNKIDVVSKFSIYFR